MLFWGQLTHEAIILMFIVQELVITVKSFITVLDNEKNVSSIHKR